MEKTVYKQVLSAIPIVVAAIYLAACSEAKPEPDLPAECDQSWTISLTPDTRFHTGPFSADVSTSAPAGNQMEYAVGVSSDGTRAWRPLETTIPVPAIEGEVEVAVRFACDVPGATRTTITYVFPDGDARVFVTPESGDYREAVTVVIEQFPADLTWDVSLFHEHGTAVAIPNNNITIPDNGAQYTLLVQGWDRYGHAVAPVSNTYRSDPYSPAIRTIVPAPGPLRPDDVFYVSFDKPLDIARSMQNNDIVVVQYISEYVVQVFPRYAWEPGLLDIQLEDFRFQGKNNSSLLTGDFSFPLLYDVCHCTNMPNELAGIAPYGTVDVGSFPLNVTIASIVAVAPASLRGSLTSLFDGSKTLFDSNDFTPVDAQQYSLNLTAGMVKAGGVYILQVTSSTTHPFSPESTAFLQFSVSTTGYTEAFTEVTAAENFFIYNHPIDYSQTLTEGTGFSLSPGPNPFTLQYNADAVTGYSFTATSLANGSYSGSGTGASTGPNYPDLVTSASLFPSDATIAVPDWGQAQWILRTPEPVTYVTPSHISVTFDTGATFFAVDLYARNTHEVVFAVRDFLDQYNAEGARVVLMFTVWFENGSSQDFLHRVDLVQAETALRPRINQDSVRTNFYSSTPTRSSLQSLAFTVDGLTASTSVTAYIDTTSDQLAKTMVLSASNRYAVSAAVDLTATDALAGIYLYARDGTGELLDSHMLNVPIASSIGFASGTTLYADSATQDIVQVPLTGNPVDTAGSSLLISRLSNSAGDTVQNWFWPAFVESIPLFIGHLDPGLYSLHVDLLTGSDPGFQRTGYSSADIHLQID